jgi:Tfp pilus assembly protein PilO
MYRLLTPILAFIVAFTLFFTFIQPTIDEYKKIDTEVSDYMQALDSADRLQQRVNELIADKNAIPQSDYERLMTFLPNSIDEVGVVLTLDDLASRSNLALDQISVQSSRTRGGSSQQNAVAEMAFDDDQDSSSQAEQTRADGTVVRKPTDSIESVMLTFSVTGEYQDFRTFIAELEKSLLLMDIVQLTISEAKDESLTSFAVGVSLYQFKSKE